MDEPVDIPTPKLPPPRLPNLKPECRGPTSTRRLILALVCFPFSSAHSI